MHISQSLVYLSVHQRGNEFTDDECKLSTVCLKNYVQNLLLNISVKNQPILIIFDTQNLQYVTLLCKQFKEVV